jgi:hypothetical protein
MSRIPKIIHQIWIGPKKLPDYCKKFCEDMRNEHPDYKYIFWGNELFEKYKGDKFIDNYKKKNMKPVFISDRFRLLLLRDYGGIYVDVDAKIIQSFNNILKKLGKGIDFFAGMREKINPGALIDITAMGSVKNSRIINECLKTYTNINFANGGLKFSNKIITVIDRDVCLLNYQYFYDIKITKNTIILHDPHRLFSWRK